MLLADAITVYLNEREPGLAPLSYRKTRDTLRRLAGAHGQTELADVTVAMLREWRDSLKVSPATANKYMDRVHTFMRRAVEAGWMDRPPIVAGVYEPPRRQSRLTADQMVAMLDAADNPRDRAMLAVALEWLLRGSEIARLKVGNIRLDDGMADVLVSKKEGAHAWDEMVVTARLSRELEAWRHAYAVAIARPLRAEDFLFPRQVSRLAGTGRENGLLPNAPISHPYLVVRNALTISGVTEGRLGFHTIRRSMARLRYDALCESGSKDQALEVVSALLHHDSLRTTELYLGVDGKRTTRNKIMRSSSWVSVLPTAEHDETPGQGLATVTRLHP